MAKGFPHFGTDDFSTVFEEWTSINPSYFDVHQPVSTDPRDCGGHRTASEKCGRIWCIWSRTLLSQCTEMGWSSEAGLSDDLLWGKKMMNAWCTTTGWWFGTFFIFLYIGNRNSHPKWLIFFRGVETTNQMIYHQNLQEPMFRSIHQWQIFYPRIDSSLSPKYRFFGFQGGE